MSLITNLEGRLRNTSLPKSHALLPLFEAVVNSIHACEEKFISPLATAKITIKILREKQEENQIVNLIEDSNIKKTGPEAQPEIIGFEVVDNGIGFTDANMDSFKELDSDYKVGKGCRGIGRLTWLKAFDNVDIISVFEEKGSTFRRIFNFSKLGITPTTPEKCILSVAQESTTVIRLNKFDLVYRRHTPKTTLKIAEELLEHCIWYFIREIGKPSIIIEDGDEKINLDDLYNEFAQGNIDTREIFITNKSFQLSFLKARNVAFHGHEICFCAADRLVKKEAITNKIPGLFKRISDDQRAFSLKCFVSSEYLNDHVRSNRTDFDIERSRPVDATQGNLLHDDIFYEDIVKNTMSSIHHYLADLLEKNLEQTRQRVHTFVTTKSPRYLPIMKYCPDFYVDPETSDKELELALYKKYQELETGLIKRGHEIYESTEAVSVKDYEQKMENYMALACDIKKSDLAAYISHRKIIIDFLEKIIQKHKDGKYSKEDVIHKLLIPMRKESNEIHFDDANLWLLDERLAFHHYLSSDKPLCSMPVTAATETLEPDIFALQVYDTPILVNDKDIPPLASISVIEIKRPMRNDIREGEKAPIEQALNYVDKIREGNVQTRFGRPIPKSEDIPAFCYIVADITPTLIKRAKIMDLHATADQMGFSGYNKGYKAYIEIIGYDRLVNGAKERNKAFFDKLGFAST